MRWLLFLGGWCSAGALAGESLTLATYNVANYNLIDRQIEGAFLAAYPKPEAERAALRRVIRGIDADVLALQEMGGEEFLRELQRDLRREGLDYAHAVALDAGDRQRQVAVLSKRKFTHVGRHTDLDFRYFEGRARVKRGLLEVRFEAPGGEIALFVVHLKSRSTDRGDDPQAKERRGREARAIRHRMLELFPEPADARLVILGDFSAGPQERPVRDLTHIGDRRISHVIAAADSAGETWTYRSRRPEAYTHIDHVLVSPPLRQAVATAMIPDEAAVHQASDHRPVVVTLELRP